jgi:hypothetical protein
MMTLPVASPAARGHAKAAESAAVTTEEEQRATQLRERESAMAAKRAAVAAIGVPASAANGGDVAGASAQPPAKKAKKARLERVASLGEPLLRQLPGQVSTAMAAQRIRAAMTAYRGQGVDHEQAKLEVEHGVPPAHAAFRVRVRAVCWPASRGGPAVPAASLAPTDWPLCACVVSIHDSATGAAGEECTAADCATDNAAGFTLRVDCKQGATAVAARLANWLAEEAAQPEQPNTT